MKKLRYHVRRDRKPVANGTYVTSNHAWERMCGRGLSPRHLELVLHYGRVTHVRGARIFTVGRKEVARYARQGIDLKACEGLHVVCSTDGTVLTAYRNHSFKHLHMT